jgi:uncharacterized protein
MKDRPITTSASRLVVGFAHALRAAGLTVPVGSVTTFAAALGCVGIDRRDRVYWAGRTTLIHHPDDVEIYDLVFESFWLNRGVTGRDQPVALPQSIGLDDGPAPEPDAPGDEDSSPALNLRWSAVEVLRDKDFAAYDSQEWDEFQRLVARLRLGAETRKSRRRRPDRHDRGHPDLRRTVRRALRTDGQPIERAWRSPSQRPRRVVLILDVSGSMATYARALLRFAHATVVTRGMQRTEVFTLGTRLTRVTRELGGRDPDAAVMAAAAAVADWSGGTRLGAGLGSFNDHWGIKGAARGAVVVILSDGWDRGDPSELAAEMVRLSRVAHRIVWANPLKASPGFAPLARGMAAALPFVDNFVEGHSLAALEHLAEIIVGSERAFSGSRPDSLGEERTVT